ncbi:HAMP domain-containing sensor histidine kinase [Falsibacillus pallidus]|uniref:Signal transduction histidine-protein kinase ArlS n=1 Tax=Falsibacillus pallidus TaxID=493781 RepID=A0A370GIH7_9BACI|nr:HAMP domain-containing histidine kinase [Falsibacillus pallidus]RDI43170.1 signal transduction histidine kinase [Falsibacillus pallidus]
MNKLLNWFNNCSLKVKWSIGASTAIFFTFFIFSFFQYHVISNWLLNEEENNVRQVLDELAIFYKQRGPDIDMADLSDSEDLIKQIVEKNQTIRITDTSGKEVFVVHNEQDPYYYIPFQPVDGKTIMQLQTNGKKLYVGRMPIQSRQFNGYVEVIYPLNRYHQMMNNLWFVMSMFGLAALVLSGVFGFLMAKNFLKPLQKLSNAMRMIQRRGFQQRMEPSRSHDEIGELTVIFNEMMDKLERSFAQQKQFVEDASHELRTPIQIMEGHLSLLNRWGKKDEVILDESLFASLQELDRIKYLVQELLELSRAEQIQKGDGEASADIVSTIERVLKNFQLLHKEYTFIFDQRGNLSHQVGISDHHLEQVLIILLDNAVKYSDKNKNITILIEEMEQDVKVIIEDKGIGIPEDQLSSIFHRFYRVDKARSREKGGNGLGLAIAKQIIEGYGGNITAESQVDEGTRVQFVLPFKS